MDFSSINWLAVVACVLASMIIGSIWFSPKVFYPAWWKAIGKTDKDATDATGGQMGMMSVWGLDHIVFLRAGSFYGADGQCHGKYDPRRADARVRRHGRLRTVAWLCCACEPHQ